jgi:hypothetical protein
LPLRPNTPIQTIYIIWSGSNRGSRKSNNLFLKKPVTATLKEKSITNLVAKASANGNQAISKCSKDIGIKTNISRLNKYENMSMPVTDFF